ncbi:hypothetical protein [Runella limosa]|uniref:hypothetical protein n=1 Tax=Runella limosa TaxID=370978 RepID=UPI0004251B42|nr:hypothetical protein [Runella limosa]
MAANEVSIIGNIGTLTGTNGTGVVYLGQVNSKYGLFYQVLNTVPDPDVAQWAFLPRDAFMTYVAQGNGTYHSGVDVASMLNDGNSATFVTAVSGNDWKVNVINDNSLPRLYNNQPFYSLRGQGVAVIDPNTATYTNSTTTAVVTTSTGSTSTSANFLENILGASTVTFIKENAVWILLIALVLAYLFYMEKKGKKGGKKSKFLGLF